MTSSLTFPYDANRIRTAALPASCDTLAHMGVSDAMHSSYPWQVSIETSSVGAGRILVDASLVDASLIERAILDALLWSGTSSPMVPLSPSKPVVSLGKVVTYESIARRAVTELKAVAQLTNEEVAALAGVSRRSVQAWMAGGAITGPKEQHLRSVVEAVRDLAATDPAGTRARLLDRKPGHVRPYDLLVEGRYEAAVALATGKRVASRSVEPSSPSNLAAQFDRYEDRVDVPERSLNRALSGRLRR